MCSRKSCGPPECKNPPCNEESNVVIYTSASGGDCNFDNYRGLHHSKKEDGSTRRHIPWRNPRGHYFQQAHVRLYWLQHCPKLLHVQFKRNIRRKHDLKRQLEAGQKWVNFFSCWFRLMGSLYLSFVVWVVIYYYCILHG